MEDKDNIEDSSLQIDLIIQGLRDLHQKLSVSKNVIEVASVAEGNATILSDKGNIEPNDGLSAGLQAAEAERDNSDGQNFHSKPYQFSSEKDTCL